LYCDRTYSIHRNSHISPGSLIDGGANGGPRGSDVVLLQTFRTVDDTFIAKNTLKKTNICTVARLIQTQHDLITGIFIKLPSMTLE
jgi:hypothetical protein